jgi:hypothetical protein
MAIIYLQPQASLCREIATSAIFRKVKGLGQLDQGNQVQILFSQKSGPKTPSRQEDLRILPLLILWKGRTRMTGSEKLSSDSI